jgi:TolB-like protein
MRSELVLGVFLFSLATAFVCQAAEVRPDTVQEIVVQLSNKVPGTEKRRIGISPFTDLATDRVDLFGKTLARELISLLSASDKFHVVTLDMERLVQVLKGELSDLKDEETRVRIGHLFGIQVLLTGSYRSSWTGTAIYVELTDLERGTVWAVRVDEGPLGQVWARTASAVVLVIVGVGLVAWRRRHRREREASERREAELHKRKADGLYAEAMGHYAAGRLREARAKAKEALALNPNHFEASVLVEKIDVALAKEEAIHPPDPPPPPASEPPVTQHEEPAIPAPPPPPKPASFQIRVWTDNADAPMKQDRLKTRGITVLPPREESRYRLGDRIVIYFASGRDCYLRLINIGPTGNVLQLFPNRYHSDNFIRAGHIYSLPGPEYGGFEFRLGPPAGLETVKAIASTSPFDLPGGEEAGAFTQFKPGDIEVFAARKPENPGATWAEDFCRFFVAERRG